MSIDFSVENDDLIIKEIHNDQIIWRGKPLNFSVRSLLEYPHKDICFILFSRKDGPKLYPGGPMKAFNNLACVDSHGKPLWIADLPSSGVDYYTRVIWSNNLRADMFKVDLDLKENTLVVFSYSGFLVNIDPENGKIISKLLIK